VEEKKMSRINIISSIEIESQLKQQNNEDKDFNLKEKIREWCESTTIHAIPNMVHRQNWLVKIMWFLFLVVFVFLAGFFVKATFFEFIEFKTDTLVTLPQNTEFQVSYDPSLTNFTHYI
jgi:hypothetical protein